MSLYDYPLDTTPNLRQFAEDEGALFTNHIAQHSECSPSRMSLLSGQYMHNQGRRTLKNLIQTWHPSHLRWLKVETLYSRIKTQLVQAHTPVGVCLYKVRLREMYKDEKLVQTHTLVGVCLYTVWTN